MVFASDEFYINAGREIPEAEYYEDYPQYENGVGLMRSLTDEFTDALEKFEGTDWRQKVREISELDMEYIVIMAT